MKSIPWSIFWYLSILTVLIVLIKIRHFPLFLSNISWYHVLAPPVQLQYGKKVILKFIFFLSNDKLWILLFTTEVHILFIKSIHYSGTMKPEWGLLKHALNIILLMFNFFVKYYLYYSTGVVIWRLLFKWSVLVQ